MTVPYLGTIPILLPSSRDAVRQQLTSLQEEFADAQEFRNMLRSSADKSAISQQLLDGLSQSWAPFVALREDIEAVADKFNLDHQDTDTVEEVAHGIADALKYAWRDWSDHPATVDELELFRARIFPHLHTATDLLLLGASTGRHLVDCRNAGCSVTGLDNSVAMASVVNRLRNGTLGSFALLPDTGVQSSANRVLRVQPVTGAKALNDVFFVVGDALQPPFAPLSFDTIVSSFVTPYFSLSHYLSAIRPLLRPRGTFVHFGPLNYHQPDPAEHYAEDEFSDAVERFGFRLLAWNIDMSPHAHLPGLIKYSEARVITAVFSKT